MKWTPQNTIRSDVGRRGLRATGPASRRRSRPRPGPRAPGSCARGSPRSAAGELADLGLQARAAHGACVLGRSLERSLFIATSRSPPGSDVEGAAPSASARRPRCDRRPSRRWHRTVSRVTPPDASSFARPAVIATASRISVGGHVVEQDDLRPRRALRAAGRACRPRPRPAVRRLAARCDRLADAAGGRDVVVLDEDRVVEADAVVAAAAAARPRTSRARGARASSCACRGSSTPVPATAST